MGQTAFFENLFKYEWELTKSPAGAHQWTPKNGGGAGTVPHAHDASKRIAPSMLTTDLALRVDPAYEKISRHFHENPGAFAEAFARAWYKLTHRDMGPVVLHLGPLKPKEVLIWQDPIPAAEGQPIDAKDIESLKAKLLGSGLSIAQLATTAWASASTFRGSDKRGGANGARIRLAPQKDWAVNQPAQLQNVLAKLEAIQKEFNAGASGGKKVSLADLIVLGGSVAVEAAAKKAGFDVTVPFTAGPHRREPGPDRRRILQVSGAGCRRVPQLSARAAADLAGRGADRPGAAPDTLGAGTDGAVGRVAGAECRPAGAGCLHRPSGDAQQRRLRQPARHGPPNGSRLRSRASTRAVIARPAR